MYNTTFKGYAAVYDTTCSFSNDIFHKGSLRINDGRTVPLLLNHDPNTVIGEAYLESRERGIYAICSLNNTTVGKLVETSIRRQYITDFSIGLHPVIARDHDIYKGLIFEVTVCMIDGIGDNPEAKISSIS